MLYREQVGIIEIAKKKFLIFFLGFVQVILFK